MITVFRRASRVRVTDLSKTERCQSSWSKISKVFNCRPSRKINFGKNGTGLFNIPELKTHEGFYLLKENVIAKTDALIQEAISDDRNRKIVEVFDELSDSLCKVADLAEFIRLAHPQANFSYAAEDACISISGVVEKLNTHRSLYKKLRHVTETADNFPTSAVDNHVAKLFLFDFEQSGIHLEEKLRQRVVYLNECILQLGQRFMAGAVNPRSVTKDIIPDGIRHFFTTDGPNIVVNGLYADSASAQARESAYKLFLYPDKHQDDLLSSLIESRHDLATICGFQTYAHRALKSSTAEYPAMVTDFLNILAKELAPRAQADFHIMQEMKNDDTVSNQLAAWDTPYYTAKIKRQWLQVSPVEFTPYFSLGGCMDGLNNLLQRLYGIRFEQEELEPGEAWTPDIYKLAVVHEHEGHLGHIYFDLFERVGKPNQDCHFTIRGGKRLTNGNYQNPIVVVMLNLAIPKWSSPTLLTPSMVDNLFHETGHAMHSMLARTEYQHVTGTRCSTDFAEVPSVLMEYFASDPRVVRTFARHFQTGEPMPEEMLQRLCASKNLFWASETQLQVFYSALDQVYHGNPAVHGGNTTETLRQVQAQYYGLPYVENTAWQLRFSHLVGYGAKYYAYLLSRAIASWIWQTYFEADPFDRAQGEKYRHECLAFGGGVSSRQLVANFLQRDVNPTNLSHSLITEIDVSNDKIQHMGRKWNIQMQ